MRQDVGEQVELSVHAELVEDSPSIATDGRAKWCVVARPPGARTGLLLARADGERRATVVGDQHAGRVGLFLRVAVSACYDRMVAQASSS